MTNGNPKVALFDMDNTICDYVGAMKKGLEKLRAPGEPVIDPFALGDNDTEHQYLWNRMDLIKANADWWANLPRLKLGFDVMDMAKKLGYLIEILTQAPRTNPAALDGKLRWILSNIEADTKFTMTRQKSSYYGRVLVDDYPGYVEPWLEHRKRGLVIMPANDYNKGFKHPQVIMYDGSNKAQVRDGLLEAMNR